MTLSGESPARRTTSGCDLASSAALACNPFVLNGIRCPHRQGGDSDAVRCDSEEPEYFTRHSLRISRQVLETNGKCIDLVSGEPVAPRVVVRRRLSCKRLYLPAVVNRNRVRARPVPVMPASGLDRPRPRHRLGNNVLPPDVNETRFGK
jgi:hypothetical protein